MSERCIFENLSLHQIINIYKDANIEAIKAFDFNLSDYRQTILPWCHTANIKNLLLLSNKNPMEKINDISSITNFDRIKSFFKTTENIIIVIVNFFCNENFCYNLSLRSKYPLCYFLTDNFEKFTDLKGFLQLYLEKYFELFYNSNLLLLANNDHYVFDKTYDLTINGIEFNEHFPMIFYNQNTNFDDKLNREFNSYKYKLYQKISKVVFKNECADFLLTQSYFKIQSKLTRYGGRTEEFIPYVATEYIPFVDVNIEASLI